MRSASDGTSLTATTIQKERVRAMRGVTPALSACRRPLHRRLVESEKPTASPRRSPETLSYYTNTLRRASVIVTRVTSIAGLRASRPSPQALPIRSCIFRNRGTRVTDQRLRVNVLALHLGDPAVDHRLRRFAPAGAVDAGIRRNLRLDAAVASPPASKV